jgi:hypothetical protein
LLWRIYLSSGIPCPLLQWWAGTRICTKPRPPLLKVVLKVHNHGSLRKPFLIYI